MEWILSKLTFPADKLGHYCVGFTIFAILHLFIFNTWALLIVAVIAGLKELYGRLHPDKHTCDICDLVATVLGGMVGFLCTLKI